MTGGKEVKYIIFCDRKTSTGKVRQRESTQSETVRNKTNYMNNQNNHKRTKLSNKKPKMDKGFFKT